MPNVIQLKHSRNDNNVQRSVALGVSYLQRNSSAPIALFVIDARALTYAYPENDATNQLYIAMAGNVEHGVVSFGQALQQVFDWAEKRGYQRSKRPCPSGYIVSLAPAVRRDFTVR